MSSAKNISYQEQSIGKSVYDFFTSILGGKSTPPPTTRRQRETNQTKRHGTKHRHHHHHRHGPHEFDREETQPDAGLWEKVRNLQTEADLPPPPQATVRSSNRFGNGIDAFAPRKTSPNPGSQRAPHKTSTNPGSQRARPHREHPSSTQNKDPVPGPPQSTVRQGKNGVIENRTENEVNPPPPAARGSHHRGRHADPRCPEVATNIPPIMKLKAGISPKADIKDPIQGVHPALRNRQVTGRSQPGAVPSQSKCDTTHTLHVEPTRDKAAVNLVPAREESTNPTSTFVESIMSNLSCSATKKSYLQEIPKRQKVLRHKGAQIMHAPNPELWTHSQEAIIINPGMSERDSVQTRLSDFIPKPLNLKSTRTAAKPVPDVSSYSEPSTPAVIRSPRPKATWPQGVVDDDGNRESGPLSSKSLRLKHGIYRSTQSNQSSPIRQTRGIAPALRWEDSIPIQASLNEARPSSSDSTQQSEKSCKICHEPYLQDGKVRDVDQVICPTCEARAFIQPYPTIAKASPAGSTASFSRTRRPSDSSKPGWIRARGIPTSPTLREEEPPWLELPSPVRPLVPPKTKTQLPGMEDRGGKGMPPTPPSSSGSSYSRFRGNPLVTPPTSPSKSLTMAQILRNGKNKDFPRAEKVWTPPARNGKVQLGGSEDLGPPSETNQRAPLPSRANSFTTCTDHYSTSLPMFLADNNAGLGINFGGGSGGGGFGGSSSGGGGARSPSSMDNRRMNFVGQYSPSMTTDEDRDDGVQRSSSFYQYWDPLLGNNYYYSGYDPGGGGGG